MTTPDFYEWANKALAEGLQRLELELVIARSLAQAFEQGRALGAREGFEEGDRSGWWKQLESDENFE